MDYEVKVIPEQKLGVINCKTPIEDLDVFLSILMGWVDAEEIETDGEPFIVYFSPRHEVGQGDVVYDVSIPIKGDADVEIMVGSNPDLPLKAFIHTSFEER